MTTTTVAPSFEITGSHERGYEIPAWTPGLDRAVIRYRGCDGPPASGSVWTEYSRIVATVRETLVQLGSIEHYLNLELISAELEPVQRGQTFEHLTQIRRDSSPKAPGGIVPEVCTVTAVREGRVWYRNSTGFRSVIDAVSFPAVVKTWLS